MLELYYPVKNPVNPTNPFGAVNAMYTALGQKGHPGLDFEAPSGTPLYCPCDGEAYYVTDSQGGDGIWIDITEDGVNYHIILWHLYPKGNLQYPFQIMTNGVKQYVKAGQLLAYTDNSGAPLESSGPHLHFGVIPCNPDWTVTSPDNGYLGCVNPAPFFNGLYAEDINTAQKAIPIVQEAVAVVSQPSVPVEEKNSVLTALKNLLIKFISSIQK